MIFANHLLKELHSLHANRPVSTLITPCACAAGGRVIGLCLSVCPQSKRCLSSEGLIEGLFQDSSVRIQKIKILAST